MPSKRPTRKAKSVSSQTKAVKRPSKRPTAKLDLYAKHKNEYVANAKKPSIVRVGPAKYLRISGTGRPDSPPFNEAIGALYTMAFTIKMAKKFAGQDYTVTKLEGLWEVDSPSGNWSAPDNVFKWDLMIRVPTFVTEKDLKAAAEQAIAKGKEAPVHRVRLTEYLEGECVQMLHIGPYSDEQRTVDKMREFAALAGRQFVGRHHEIYFSDPRRVPPERLKTILRNPIG